MTDDRTVEDRLRAEYFELLPEARLVLEYLETEVKHNLLPVTLSLKPYERLLVTSRLKECESAVDALRRRQEGGMFDPDQVEVYSLTALNDFAGVRVMAFPAARVHEADTVLRKTYPDWISDSVPGLDPTEPPMALKYHGLCHSSRRVQGEFQIVPLLTGLFWEVEHSAIYKPAPSLKGVDRSLAMQQRTQEVLRALCAFEREFERQISASGQDSRSESER